MEIVTRFQLVLRGQASPITKHCSRASLDSKMPVMGGKGQFVQSQIEFVLTVGAAGSSFPSNLLQTPHNVHRFVEVIRRWIFQICQRRLKFDVLADFDDIVSCELGVDGGREQACFGEGRLKDKIKSFVYAFVSSETYGINPPVCDNSYGRCYSRAES